MTSPFPHDSVLSPETIRDARQLLLSDGEWYDVAEGSLVIADGEVSWNVTTPGLGRIVTTPLHILAVRRRTLDPEVTGGRIGAIH